MILSEPVWLDRVDSTNTRLRELARAGAAGHGYVLAAREQTGGRGRRGKAWFSGLGNLTFSFYVRSGRPAAELLSLPMAAAAGVREFLAGCGVADCRLKWPNDVLARGGKICGILAETAAGEGLAVGVGVNLVLTAAEAAALGRPAASVLTETGRLPAPEAALAGLLLCLEKFLTRWEEEGFAGIRKEWERHFAVAAGETLAVSGEAGRASGEWRGFGNCGELLLEAGGMVSAVWSGAVE